MKFSMAVKANPHIISIDDMKSIFSSFVDNNFQFLNLIKMASGEIKFFKDYLFHLKYINKDIEMYKKLGKYPFYRQLMDRKRNRGINFLVNVIHNLFKGRKFSNEVILPKYTFIANEEEIEYGFKKKIKLLYKDKDIQKFVNKLMLLCIGTYDNAMEFYSFYFNGLQEAFLFNEKELKRAGSKKSVEDMASALKLLATKL